MAMPTEEKVLLLLIAAQEEAQKLEHPNNFIPDYIGDAISNTTQELHERGVEYGGAA